MTREARKPDLRKPFDQMYTRIVIDPVAMPLARFLAQYRWITPNRITVIALVLGIAAAVCFAGGWLRYGGALYLVRFFVDCVDGKVAKCQAARSERGAALDLCVDVCTILLCSAALSWYLITADGLSALAGLGLLIFIGIFNWALQYRKQLAERYGLGSGGASRDYSTRIRVLRGYLSWCKRMSMNPVPYAVEMENVALGIVPVVGVAAVAAWGMRIALVFYILASSVNVLRIWRIAGRIDSAGRVDSAGETDGAGRTNRDP